MTTMHSLTDESITMKAGQLPVARRASDPSGQVESAAFDDLFHLHWHGVYGVLYRLLGDAAEAEDLALETFWRYWERPPARSDNVAGWLYRVAMNLGYNALRAARRRSGYEARAGWLVATEAAPLDPAGAAEQVEARARVQAVLSELPSRDAQLLLLRHGGLSYQEIAAAIGVAPGSVGTLLSRAERAFQVRMDMEERGEPL
jgi:RNA polymerase sigma-70 factor (ECF subfamily)